MLDYNLTADDENEDHLLDLIAGLPLAWQGRVDVEELNDDSLFWNLNG